MSRYLSEETIEEVRSAADIVTVASEYLNVKKAGASYKALCPFHSEKTPSFLINPERQIFKCFGCGEAGNVFNLVMGITGLSFVEVVTNLAYKYGVIIDETGQDTQEHSKQQKLKEIMHWAVEFYKKKLETSGQKAWEYLKQRKIDDDIIEKFQLGYAPPGWDNLLQNGKKAGYSIDEMKEAGLIIQSSKSEERYYDRFRDRLMFPIWNIEGKTIAFGGRILSADQNPKYLNSPETSFFLKSKVLYALNIAKNSIMKEDTALVMEGYTDVLMAHQHGFTNAVATLGTSLTGDHAKIIKRYAKSSTLIFDGDDAGLKAADRSLNHFLKQDILLKVAVLPGAKDPFDFLLSEGEDAFRKIVHESQDFLDFKIALLAQKHDLRNTSTKRQAIQELTKIINEITDNVTKQLVINRLGEYFSIPPELLRTYLSPKRIKSELQPITFENCREKFQSDEERFLLWSSLHFSNCIESIFQNYDISNFINSNYSTIASELIKYWKENNTVDIAPLSSKLGKELAQELVNIYYYDYGSLDEDNVNIRLDMIYKGLKRKKYSDKLKSLKTRLINITPKNEKVEILQNIRNVCKERMHDI